MTMTRAQLVHGHRLFFAGVFSVAVLVVLHAPDAGAGTTASSADSIEWTVLVPEELVSSGGASFTKQDDGSILVGGAAVEADTYTFEVSTGLAGITGFRLEVLPDASLARGGPG